MSIPQNDRSVAIFTRPSAIEELSQRGYSIGRKIGRGCFANVLTAVYCDDNGKCVSLACKVINKTKAPSDFLQKFFPRELDILTKIEHPNIIQIHSILQRGSKIYIFMRYAENGDMLDYIKHHGPINEQQSKKWFSQMVGAMQYLHAKDISHRDLKCENILLSRKMNIKLADFGFARHCLDDEGKKILSQTYCGSAAYAAPEIVKGTPYDPKLADVWSLGVILFIMLNSKLPFDDANVEKLLVDQQGRKFAFSPTLEKSISNEAKSMVNVILEPEPELRWSLGQIENSRWLGGDKSGELTRKDDPAGEGGSSLACEDVKEI